MVVIAQDHSHPKNFNECEALVTKRNIVRRAKETSEAPVDIVTSISARCDEDVIRKMPKLKTLLDGIGKTRNRLIEQGRANDCDIPPCLQKTLDGTQFLFFDSGVEDENRYVIFASIICLNSLKKTKVWLSDGTFKSCPKEFYQVYVIHGHIYGITVPLVYILMSGKTEAMYCIAFEKLREIGCAPDIIIVDYESAVISAYKKVLP